MRTVKVHCFLDARRLMRRTCSTLGAVFMQQGLSAKRANDAEQAESMLAAAAKFYKKAAETYPPDDEKAPCKSPSPPPALRAPFFDTLPQSI